MLRTFYSLVVLACLIKIIYGVDYYSIVGSKVIKPNSAYAISVSLLDANQSAIIKLTIQNENSYKLTKSVFVQPRSTQVVQFSIGKLDQGNYKLVAEGPSGLPFTSEALINLPTKNQSCFIQTDKAMYKPGDTVKFRVLVVDSDLNPAKINKMNIFVADTTRNRIKQWLNVVTTAGVYTQDLQLSTNPPLGIWNINVEVNGEVILKEFEIAEYVLPKFEVTVSAPKDSTYSDGSVRLTVTAKYTYGESVKGTALVSVSSQSWSATPGTTIVEKQFEINGNGFVDIQMSELKVSSQNWEDSFDVKASVTESLTGKVLKGTTTLTIRRSKFTVTKVNEENTYTPGKSFTLILQFAYYDGSPYININAPIKISYGPNYDKTNTTFLKTGYMDSTGVAKTVITLPDTTNGFYIFAQVLDFYDYVGYYTKPTPRVSTDTNSITARLITKNAKINDVISIEITSTKPLSNINCLISSRGKLLLSARKALTNSYTFIISFTATFSMVPSANFLAYYLVANGDIVSTIIDVPVTGLNNFVEVQTSAAEKQPGETVTLTISTKPSSNVCLLGVDQSVVLLKSGNDILPSDVYSELGEYNYFVNSYPSPIGGPIRGPVLQLARKKRSILPPNVSQGGFADFDSANVFILTNANRPLIPIWYSRDVMMPMMAMAPPPEAAPITENTATAAAPRIRKFFPETWLWNCSLSSSGSLILPQLVPDTITSWYITAFATNEKFGLGITEDKTVFKVFKQFFISLNLPYSIKRGETIALSIVVFNYMSQKVTAKVTLDNSRKEFEFVDPLTQIYRDKGCQLDIELSRSKSVTIPPNDGAPISFLITPLTTGKMTIKVVATSPIAGDGIEVTLPVVPEGVPQYKNKAKFVDLREDKTYSTHFTVDVPAYAVINSTQVSFSLIGQIMGVTLKNIELLIRLPCGCGEQTALGLAPDIVILLYLTKVGLLTGEIQIQLIHYLEVGYQGELSYKHTDGSFSAFGTSDDSGSTWLTAFVVRLFIQASDFITIDNGVIIKALEWLKSLQNADGSFAEPGRVIHSDMQGQASKGVALTAYVIIAFAQNEVNANKYADVISKALSYVIKTLDSFVDVYSLAIACYAAQLTNDASKDSLLQKLDDLATVQGDLRYWEKVKLTTPSDPWCQPPSINVEITSYALLAYIKAGRVVDGLPIMRWLLSQQSSTGGFSSTQDTVMGVTALAAFASEISSGNSMSCVISYEASQSTIKINAENSLVLQTVELPSNTDLVKLTCTGSGFSLAQLSYQYNLNGVEISPRFKLSVEIDKNANDYILILNICTSFIADGDDDTSNMAVIEAELPSGFVADLQTIKENLLNIEGIKKIETRKGNTVVVIYLDNVGANQICLQIIAYRICQIADEKPVAVQVYDYYNNIRRKTVFYQTKTKDVCGICVEDDCKAACSQPINDISCPKRTA